MIQSIHYENGEAIITITDHPTIAINQAYDILLKIMPPDIAWRISNIHYTPGIVYETDSCLIVRAGPKKQRR